MKFRKKGELLEYLGKDRKDVRLIDRMIVRGEVKRENGMYIYESDAEVIEELKKENKNLKEQLSRVSNPDLENELNEAKIQWEYWE